MCDFKPGDEVVFVAKVPLWDGENDRPAPDCSKTYTCVEVGADSSDVCGVCLSDVWVLIDDGSDFPLCPCTLRKVQKRLESLKIESFMTMPGGYEEPRRKAPEKARTGIKAD